MPRDPLKVDPSQTGWLRRRFTAAIRKRLGIIRTNIGNLVGKEDAFGLTPRQYQPLTFNTRWIFETDAEKYQSYQQWLDEQLSLHLLGVAGSGADVTAPWLAEFITSAYRTAAIRAFIETRRTFALGSELFAGSQEEFLREAFNTPVAQQQLRLLYLRSYEQLKGVSADMSKEMGRILAQGLAHGTSPKKLARELQGVVTGISRNRAEIIAHTEILHSHAEATLDSFERLGVENVGVLAEWNTAGDDRVCPRCAALEGIVLPVAQARGLLPRHPRCRCVWLPAGIPGETPFRGKVPQKPKPNQIQAAIRKSLLAERKSKLSIRKAKGLTSWAGVQLLKRR